MMACPTLTTFTPSSSASKCVHHICMGSFIMPSCKQHAMGFVTFARASRSSSGVPILHGILHHTKDMFMGSIACQVPYEVIIMIQELHDPNKGCKVIKSPTVGPRTSLGLLHQARGFIGFFNHLNHTRRPPRVKIHHDITCGVGRPSPRVP